VRKNLKKKKKGKKMKQGESEMITKETTVLTKHGLGIKVILFRKSLKSLATY
jgi:hypothetical protein